MSRSSNVWLVIAGIALAAFACRGERVNGERVNRDDMMMLISVDSLIVQAGQAAGATVGFARRHDVDVPIMLVAHGAPVGATVAFGRDRLTGASTSTILVVSLASAVVPGTYPITIFARRAGAGDHTATFRLVIASAVRPAVKGRVRARGGSGVWTFAGMMLPVQLCPRNGSSPRTPPVPAGQVSS